jgi:hypothetical protein
LLGVTDEPVFDGLHQGQSPGVVDDDHPVPLMAWRPFPLMLREAVFGTLLGESDVNPAMSRRLLTDGPPQFGFGSDETILGIPILYVVHGITSERSAPDTPRPRGFQPDVGWVRRAHDEY